MPDYEYEAFDSSGKLVTGTCSHENKALAWAELEKLDLYPVRLAMPPSSIVKKQYWDGTFGDAFQWFFYGVCLPVAGLIGAWEAHPAVGMVLAAIPGLIMIPIRLRSGKWPKGDNNTGSGSNFDG